MNPAEARAVSLLQRGADSYSFPRNGFMRYGLAAKGDLRAAFLERIEKDDVLPANKSKPFIEA